MRWCASHFVAAKVVYLNYESIIGHLEYVLLAPAFNRSSDKNTREQARLLLNFFKQRDAYATLGLILDVQYIFKGASETFQVYL